VEFTYFAERSLAAHDPHTLLRFELQWARTDPGESPLLKAKLNFELVARQIRMIYGSTESHVARCVGVCTSVWLRPPVNGQLEASG